MIDVESFLRFYVKEISVERNVLMAYENLIKTQRFIEDFLTENGYRVELQHYTVEEKKVANLWVELEGFSNEIIVVGAHYDSVLHCPGANDNATGVACLLLLAKKLRKCKFRRRIRFVFFVNEEPPFFQTPKMGSYVYAQSIKGENITAMLSLETLGYYTNKPNSQDYPLSLIFKMKYPSTGNFLAFVSNPMSSKLMKRALELFKQSVSFPTEGGAYPECIPGVGWSDQWSFWKIGVPAVMLTDTAPFRYPFYHSSEDTPDKINYPALAKIYTGIESIVKGLAQDKVSYK